KQTGTGVAAPGRRKGNTPSPPAAALYASVASSSSSFSDSPVTIASAIGPEFWRTAASIFAALTDALAVVGEPGARLLDHAGLDAEIDQLADLGDALAVHDVELDLLERWCQLVLHHLDAGLVADDLVAVLDRADAADVETHRGIELERVAAGRRLRRAVHHADLHADLVD